MKTPETRSWLQSALLLVAASFPLAGCDEMTRFKQERYECGNNPNGLVEIDFRDFKKGANVTVTFTDGSMTMPIIESSDERFTLVGQGLILRVDRESGAIRLTRGTRYLNVKCKKSKFRM